MKRDYAEDYVVTINLDKERFTEDDVSRFINESLLSPEDDTSTLRLIDGHTVVLDWKVPCNEGSHEIENALYYLLNDDELGTYSYKCLEKSE